ncbi:SRPBCC family protein [Streptomyces termitum]|uniref:SRPBCC family protein n=1 Tax=Streptomyces termitum TaxID=67368 RepID=UPI0033BBBEFB
MAQWNRLIDASPDDVWSVLSEPRLYSQWVVGARGTWERDDRWPEPGTELGYELRLGPWTYRGRTVSRRCEPPHRLELEARAALGTARIALRVDPWGDGTLVIVDEHPLDGPAARWHNALADTAVRLRHRRMLARLAALAESVARQRASAGGPGR